MKVIRSTIAVLALLGTAACMAPVADTTQGPAPTVDPTPVSTAPVSTAAAAPARTYLFSWGMFADPVFDRDVETFSQAYARAYGMPDGSVRYGANSPRLERPDVTAIESDLASFASAAVDGQDLIVVMLTSHGAPDSIAVQFDRGGPVAGLSADGLAELLAPLNNDKQIIILQACFSGSLIDELRHPNRIIMTAASADRSSFGCNPDSDNTWFIKSLNRAMAEGGTWEQVFARTRAYVTADEAAQGMPASNPQRYVGANMRDIWQSPAL